MGVRDEVLSMLTEEGLSPPGIARRRQVSLETILGYLDQLVGRGRLRRSDVLFSMPTDKRHAIVEKLRDGHSQTVGAILARVKRSRVDVDENDVKVIQRYYGAGHALGEMYEDVRTIEVQLHHVIRQALENEFGADELGWWRKGIPSKIRVECHRRREEDEFDPPSEPYCYTYLIDLKEILKTQWRVVGACLPPHAVDNRKGLLSDLERLNRIRRFVMHPVRGGTPLEDDFEFVHSLKERLGFE